MASRQGLGWGWRLIVLFLLILIVLFSRSVYRMWGKNEEAKTSRLRVESELAAVEARFGAAERRVKRLETPRGQEAEVRRNFPVAREGERVVIIFDESASTTIPDGKKPAGWWKSLWTRD